jgi:NTE family protein
VVLGGGGATGEAWEVGLLRGLRDAGIDVSQADLVVGTSAGAIVAVQLRVGQSLDALYDGQIGPAGPRAPLDLRGVDLGYFQETSRLWQGVDTTPAQRIEVGRRALAAPRVISEDAWVQRWASALGGAAWPSRPLLIAVIDVLDGSTRLVDGTQGVPLERAVAASSALPGLVAPIWLGDRQYMDGAVGGTHLNAAAGYGLVVGAAPAPRPGTAREIEELRARGSQVVNVTPDADSRAALGPNSLDRARLRPSAEAGLRQAAAVAAELAGLWHGVLSAP